MTRKQKQTRLAVIAGALLVAAVAVASRDMDVKGCVRCRDEGQHEGNHFTVPLIRIDASKQTTLPSTNKTALALPTKLD